MQATKKNIRHVVRRLQELVVKADGEYREKLIQRIIALCSSNGYANLTDFEWCVILSVPLFAMFIHC